MPNGSGWFFIKKGGPANAGPTVGLVFEHYLNLGASLFLIF
jgi:hypothetical protein